MGENEPGRTTEIARFLDFGEFRLDRHERLLFHAGSPVPLPPKAIDLLIALTDEPGALRSKEALLARVWPDVVVEEANLTQNIFLLRKALDVSGSPHIETVPRRGYRFVGVTRTPPGGAEAAVREEPSTPPPDPPPPTRFAVPAVVAVAVALALAIGAIAGWRQTHPHGDAMRSIAVLPFQPADGTRGDRLLELGLADTLINKLSQISEIVVMPTHAVTPYLDGHADPLAAGRELGVDAVLEGNIQRAGHRIRCTVRLLRVADGNAVWADRYDEESDDVFGLEDRMADRVASALDLRLSPQQRTGLSKRYTNDSQAYGLYLQGHLAWERFDAESLEESVRYFEAALRRDPHYALAWGGLAKAYSVMGIYGPLPPEQAFAKCREAALRALALDPMIPAAHTALAATGIFRDWSWTMAEEEVQRALDIDPASDAHTLRAYILEARGKPSEALAELRRERELDPLWYIPKNDYVLGLYYARRYDDAVREGLALLTIRPKNRLVRYVVGRALLQRGRMAEARAQQEANVSAFPDYSYSVAELGALAALRGDYGAARARFAQTEALRAGDKGRRVNIALASAYAELGDADAAFRALDGSLRDRYPFLWQVRINPSFDAVRNDPRYARLLGQLNLGSPSGNGTAGATVAGAR